MRNCMTNNWRYLEFEAGEFVSIIDVGGGPDVVQDKWWQCVCLEHVGQMHEPWFAFMNTVTENQVYLRAWLILCQENVGSGCLGSGLQLLATWKAPKWPDRCSSGENSEELRGRITTGHVWLISRDTGGVSVERFCETLLSSASWNGYGRQRWL